MQQDAMSYSSRPKKWAHLRHPRTHEIRENLGSHGPVSSTTLFSRQRGPNAVVGRIELLNTVTNKTRTKHHRIWKIMNETIYIRHAIQKMNILTGDIQCSIQQSALYCCSLFSYCLIHRNSLLSWLKRSRSRSRWNVYTGQNFSIQIAI